MAEKFCMEKKILVRFFILFKILKKGRKFIEMDDTLRIILIIIVSVSIFGLILFVLVKNYMKRKIDYFLEQKNKKKGS